MPEVLRPFPEAESGFQPPNWIDAVADPIRLGIVRRLSELGDATASDLANLTTASSQTLRRHLEALVANGLILEQPGQSDGETPGRPAARFSLRSEHRESIRQIYVAGALRPSPAPFVGPRPAR